jgi:D-hydroxyproline dehydrogenase subunit gamma
MMFRRLQVLDETVSLSVNGRPVRAAKGDMVATALLLAGISHFRTTAKSALPRGVFCGMGVCFECLVTIDGIGNRQACMVSVQDGMIIETGSGARLIVSDPK